MKRLFLCDGKEDNKTRIALEKTFLQTREILMSNTELEIWKSVGNLETRDGHLSTEIWNTVSQEIAEC